jgi:hypothetical protein
MNRASESSRDICASAGAKGSDMSRRSATLRFYLRKGAQHIIEQVLGAGDCAFQLLFRHLDHIAIVEAIAQLVQIVKSAPALS